jgi:hypothetical protein
MKGLIRIIPKSPQNHPKGDIFPSPLLPIIIKVVHTGGKIMHHVKALGKMVLILGFSLVTFGCAIGKNQKTITNFEISASTVPEGILITFNNIPADASHMWLYASTFINNSEENEIPYKSASTYASITNGSGMDWHNSTHNLDKIKKTRKIILPVVHTGEKYNISATIYNEQDFTLMRSDPEYDSNCIARTEIIADRGVNFNRNDVKLILDENHTVATIVSEPIFSSDDLMFDEQKYNFGITIKVEEKGFIGVADYHYKTGLSTDGLTWVFEPQMTNTLKEHADWLERGTYYSAWAEARVNIVYDDIKWSVEIAKSSEFKYSL